MLRYRKNIVRVYYTLVSTQPPSYIELLKFRVERVITNLPAQKSLLNTKLLGNERKLCRFDKNNFAEFEL